MLSVLMTGLLLFVCFFVVDQKKKEDVTHALPISLAALPRTPTSIM